MDQVEIALAALALLLALWMFLRSEGERTLLQFLVVLVVILVVVVAYR